MPTRAYPDEPGILDESELPTVYLFGVQRKVMSTEEAEKWAGQRALVCGHPQNQPCKRCDQDAVALEAAIACGGVVISPMV